MAKRMQYSVVGLPHYTIWHLYEPSVDDIRHMEEMEAERITRENTEKEVSERKQKEKDASSKKDPEKEQERLEYEQAAAQKEKEVDAGKEKGQDSEYAVTSKRFRFGTHANKFFRQIYVRGRRQSEDRRPACKGGGHQARL